jgi:hypothetical protein
MHEADGPAESGYFIETSHDFIVERFAPCAKMGGTGPIEKEE